MLSSSCRISAWSTSGLISVESSMSDLKFVSSSMLLPSILLPLDSEEGYYTRSNLSEGVSIRFAFERALIPNFRVNSLLSTGFVILNSSSSRAVRCIIYGSGCSMRCFVSSSFSFSGWPSAPAYLCIDAFCYWI